MLTGKYKGSAHGFLTPWLAALFLCAVVVCMTCGGESSLPSLESPHWLLNGVPAPSSTSIKTLIDSVIPHHRKFLPRFSEGYFEAMLDNYDCGPELGWRIDTIGKWESRTVVDIIQEVQCHKWEIPGEQYTLLVTKATAVEVSTNEYRMIYLSWSEPGNISFQPSKIIQVDGRDILYTRSQMSGTGHFFDEAYWVWDDKGELPRKLDIHGATGFAFGRVLPSGHGVWKGGHFDINTLSFESYTWRNGDGNCCPTGGKVSIDFDILSAELVVDKAMFDFSDLEERALWSAQHSEDSIYLKQPPNVFNRDRNATEAEGPNWLYFDSHRRKYVSAPEASTLSTLVDRYVRSAVSPSIYSNPETTPFAWSVDTIGAIQGHPIVEIPYSFHCPTCRDTTGFAIAAEIVPSLFRVIYQELTLAGLTAIEKSSIIVIGSDSLIAVRGNSSYQRTYENNYWLWPADYKAPISLHQEWVLRETLSQIVGADLEARQSVVGRDGAWDIRKLSYESAISQKSDNDAVSIKVPFRIQFGIRSQRLVPLDIVLDPPDTIPAPRLELSR